MSLLSKAAIAAGICGTIFVAYCVYFDRKRRSDPNFKKKLKERRKANEAAINCKNSQRKMPDLRNHEAVQMFFLREVQLGEELLGRGEVDLGVEHLCNAIAVCGQPNQLLGVLQQTLPPHVFQLIIQRLPEVNKRLEQANPPGGQEMAEEDVE